MKVLVIGASTNPSRYSNIAINDLLRYKHDVYALGRRTGEVNGVEIKTEKELIKALDTVTLYLNPKNQEEYKDYILKLKPRRVIFNPGTENPEFAEELRKNDIYPEVACTLVLLRTNQF